MPVILTLEEMEVGGSKVHGYLPDALHGISPVPLSYARARAHTHIMCYNASVLFSGLSQFLLSMSSKALTNLKGTFSTLELFPLYQNQKSQESFKK